MVGIFQFDQGFGGNGFDFGYDQVGLFLFDQCGQGGVVGYVDDVGVMCDLLVRGVFVMVNGNDFYVQVLQGDDDFFVEFVGVQQYDFGGGRRQWSVELDWFFYIGGSVLVGGVDVV